MQGTLIQLLHDSAVRYPDKDAIVQGEQRLSYAELWQRSCGLAHELVDAGIGNGDRVALLMDNSPDYVIGYYATLLAGGAVVGLNTAARARDLANWVRHSGAKIVIASSRHRELEHVRDLVYEAEISFIVIDNSTPAGWRTIECRDSGPEVATVVDPRQQLASLIYTSGTTGHPKGVMLSHGNIYSNVLSILGYLNLENTDSVLNVLPFYYSYGNSVLHTHIAAGATVILENSMLYPQRIVAAMADNRVTGFSGVPSTFNLLLNRVKLTDFDLSGLRYLTQAGGPMAPSAIKEVKRELPGAQFFVMYGQTEASARLSYLPPEKLEAKQGSIGIAIPGVELEIMDERGHPVGADITGEIYARGDNIMLGYWNDEEGTRNVFHDGWLKTGDLAYKDEDGYLFIVGRSSEMIKSGAHRISPKDIEEVLFELEGVEDAAVVGVEDALLGQVIKAVIVSSPGVMIDRKKVMRHCKANLANYKLPKFVEFAEQIPRTASGKVRRFMLQK